MEIYYKNSKGKKIYLDRFPYIVLDEATLFDSEWDYQANEASTQIIKFSKKMKTKDADINISGSTKEEYYKNVSMLVSVFDTDIISAEPGELHVGEYYLPCYFYKNIKSGNFRNVKKSTITFSVVAENDQWIKETCIVFRPGTVHEAGQNLDYPHDYPYDYANGLSSQKLVNDSISTCDFEMIIYGTCANPNIRIGDNQYNVDCVVDTGEYLVINSKKCKVYKKKIDGEIENCFYLRNREYYIFEKIPTGNLTVVWNGLFGFDITLSAERSEPEWT